jgi:hypothetical protein
MTVAPAKSRLIEMVPMPVLVRLLQRWIKTDHFKTVASSHALAAHDEMLQLACEFRQLVQKSNTRTPAIDMLFAACEAFNPNT